MSAPGPTGPHWQRVHPITPLLRVGAGVSLFVVLIITNVVRNVDNVQDFLDGLARLTRTGPFRMLEAIVGSHVAAIVLVLILALLLVCGGFALEWWRTLYVLDTDAVEMRRGILFRSHTRLPYDRIQALDITRPLLARLLGLGALTIEAAGGKGSNVQIGFLSLARLEELRAEIEARAVARPGADDVGEEPDGDTEAGAHAAGDERARGTLAERLHADNGLKGGEYELFRVPSKTLIGAQLRSRRTIHALIALVFAIVGQVGVVAASIGSDGLSLAVLIPFIFLFLGAAKSVFSSVTGLYGCRADVTRRGIRITSGLTKTVSQTIMPGRVHGLVVKQHLLWRGQDWWSVEVIQAGYSGSSQEGTRSSETLLPVGTRTQVKQALWILLPELTLKDAEAVIDAALSGSGPAHGFSTIAPGARVLHPLVKNRESYRLTPQMLITRTGLLTRKALFLDLDHIQSVSSVQGPLARWRGCRSVQAHLVSGLSTSESVAEAKVLRTDEARVLFDTLARAAGREADDEKLDDWYTRVTASME